MLARRQHGDHHVGAMCRLGRAGRHLATIVRERYEGRVVQVVAGDDMACLDQIGGHRPTHVTEFDEADFRHDYSTSKIS